MTELRRDVLTGQWVILAPERGRRPMDFQAPGPSPEPDDACPFCAGREDRTPPELLALRDPGSPANGPGWRVRVIPNRFPALRVEEALVSRREGQHEALSGVGAHELILEAPEHERSLTALSEERLAEVLGVYQRRLQDLRRDPKLAYGLIFKNVGPRAGASLEHTHSQLIALPVIPERVQTEMDRCARHFSSGGGCLLCGLLRRELESGARVAFETDGFIALEPFAARAPFETHLLPREHLSHFEDLGPERLDELARLLRRTLRAIERALDGPDYNFLIHTAPLNVGSIEHYHWHLEIIPRVAGVAGFEWGTGFHINTVAPEVAAGILKSLGA